MAIVISAADPELEWPGDYYWARWDDAQGASSQKDGGDQLTNFDFAGRQIRDPAKANWQVNVGPISGGIKEGVVVYYFFGFMFVPPTGVDII